MTDAEKRLIGYELYGLTLEQYHAGLDKLWKALGRFVDDVPNEDGFSDIFSLCAAELDRLRNELSDQEQQMVGQMSELRAELGRMREKIEDLEHELNYMQERQED